MALNLLKCTLVIPRRSSDNSILLAQKARGMGRGKWMGFGGKLEPGETVEHAAVRELAEETGLTLDQKQLSKVGLLLFTFECQPNLFLEVHVYETFAIRTLPTLCDEFFPPPTWFKEEDVPKQFMWADFALWSHLLFQGKRFRARVAYSDLSNIVESNVTILENEVAHGLSADASWTKSATNPAANNSSAAHS